METLLLKRTTPMDTLFSFVGASDLVRIEKESGRATISPVIDPADYDNETDYINAIPGMAEKLIMYHNAPASEFEPASPESFNV